MLTNFYKTIKRYERPSLRTVELYSQHSHVILANQVLDLHCTVPSKYSIVSIKDKNSSSVSSSINSFMNVNNSKLLLFIPAILEHVSRNRTCSIGKLRTHNKKHVITEPSRTPGLSSELDLSDHSAG